MMPQQQQHQQQQQNQHQIGHLHLQQWVPYQSTIPHPQQYRFNSSIKGSPMKNQKIMGNPPPGLPLGVIRYPQQAQKLLYTAYPTSYSQ
jgi:hypothetical protein